MFKLIGSMFKLTIAGVVLLGIILFLAVPKEAREKVREERERTDQILAEKAEAEKIPDEALQFGYAAARVAAKSQLRFPEKAKWPWSGMRVAKTEAVEGNPTFVVRGEVESPNALGAMLKNQWKVVVSYDEENEEWDIVRPVAFEGR